MLQQNKQNQTNSEYLVMSSTFLSSRIRRNRGKRKLTPRSPLSSAYIFEFDTCAHCTSITRDGLKYTSIFNDFGRTMFAMNYSVHYLKHCNRDSRDTSQSLNLCDKLLSCAAVNPLPTQQTGRIYE